MSLTLPLMGDYQKPYNCPAGRYWKRPDVKAPTVFDAIASGECVAITRFMDYSSPYNLERFKALKPGEELRLFQCGRPSHLLVQAQASSLSHQQMAMDLPETQGLGGCTHAISLARLRKFPNELERWSLLEGYTAEAGLLLFSAASSAIGYQLIFEFIALDKDII